MSKDEFFSLDTENKCRFVMDSLCWLIMAEDFLTKTGFVRKEQLDVIKIVLGFYYHEIL